ncbi:MAG: DNA polymerase III subunit chi [Acidiferrobacterales bacterium]|nr:DNA polymerase III subunit chi [Acidiferrobacterales bacterium]
MPKQVDFYLIENQVNDAKFKLASRLSNKLLKLKKRTLIATDSADQNARLDGCLWSYSGTSFVAHDDVSTAADSLIQIGSIESINPQVLERDYEVLISLCDKTPLFSHHFNRIVEIIEPSEDEKKNGRERYKSYQQEGFEIKTHSLEL